MSTPADELAAAVEGRPGWHVDPDGVAVYRPGGADAQVRVRVMARPVDRRRENFGAALLRAGRVTDSAACYSAHEAIRWAERLLGARSADR